MSLNSKQLYWFKENGRYTIGKLIQGYPINIREKILPQLSSSFERELQKLAANYQIEKDGQLSIFDPNIIEWEEITAPVLKKKGFNILGELGKYTGKIPSNKMMEAAQEYYIQIHTQMYKNNLPIEKNMFDKYFETYSKDGISVWWNQEFWTYLRISNFDKKYLFFDLSYCFGNDTMTIQGLVILKSAIDGKNSITLNVPKRYIGTIIGKGGHGIKNLMRKLKVQYIDINAIS